MPQKVVRKGKEMLTAQGRVCDHQEGQMDHGKNSLGAMIVRGKACLGVMSPSSPISWDKSPSSLFDESPLGRNL